MKYPTTAELDEAGDNVYALRHQYPHFFVYCQLQLGRPIRWGEHWENAKVIAGIPESKLRGMTLEDFIAEGFEYYKVPPLP